MLKVDAKPSFGVLEQRPGRPQDLKTEGSKPLQNSFPSILSEASPRVRTLAKPSPAHDANTAAVRRVPGGSSAYPG
jgi:hypothetical protein